MNDFTTRAASKCGALICTMVAASLTIVLSTIVPAQPAPLPDKPFAEHRIALQLSDNDPKKQGLIISVAYNLLKFYDPDKVAIEVVAFGPGIDLLRPDNDNRKRTAGQAAKGVRFD